MFYVFRNWRLHIHSDNSVQSTVILSSVIT